MKITIDSIVLLTDRQDIIVVYTDGRKVTIHSDKDVLKLLDEVLSPIASNCTTLTQYNASLEDTAAIDLSLVS